MINSKSIFTYLCLVCLAASGVHAQSSFHWGGYVHLNQGNIPEIYEWRNFFCIEGCSSVGRQPAFSYEVGLMGQFSFSEQSKLELKIGYQDFTYFEEETWSDGANFYVRETERNLQHLLMGLGFHHRWLSLGTKNRQLYVLGGIQALWNTKQEENMEINTFAATVREWNSLAELGLGVVWKMGKMQVQTGPHFRFALNNFAKTEEILSDNFDQLRPQEIGLRVAILFP